MIELRVFGTIDLRGDGVEAASLLSQTKRVALLAFLAAATPRGFHRRDTLLATFWPELDDQRARRALNQAIYAIRSVLGEDAIVSRGDDELGIDDNRLWCDARAFGTALEQGRAGEALELYRGELLEGFHLTATPDFERWLDRERDAMRPRVTDAAWAMAEMAEREGDVAAATRWARKAASFAADDESSLRRLVSFLDRVGDRTAAVQAYEAFAWRLAQEYELEPSPETKDMVDAIRARERLHQPGEDATESEPAPPAVSESLAGSAQAPTKHSALIAPYKGRVALGSLVGLGVIVAIVLGTRGPEYYVENPRQSFVIMPFHIATDSDAISWMSEGAPNMLALDLARWQDVRVVDRRRIEALAAERGVSTADATLEHAFAIARDARVGTLVVGDIIGHAGNIEVAVRVYDVSSEDPMDVVGSIQSPADGDLRPEIDRVAAEILELSGAPTLDLDLETATTSSLGAYREYLLGLDALLGWEFQEAETRFRSAVEQDSTFALAYHRLAHSLAWRGEFDQDEVRRLTELAVRYSENLPWRPRRHVLASNAFHHGELDLARELYEELVARDSTDAEAWYLLADVEFSRDESVRRDADGGLVPTWDIRMTLEGYERSVELDPRFTLAYANLFNVYWYLTSPGFTRIKVPDAMIGTGDPMISDGYAFFGAAWRDSAFWLPLDPASPGAEVRRYKSDSANAILRDRAVRTARRWSNVVPDASRPYLELRNLYFDARSWSEARAAQQAYLQLEGDTSYADRVVLGVLHLGSGSFDSAVALVENALELDPELRRYNPAAGVLIATGQPTRAITIADVQPSGSYAPAAGHNIEWGFTEPLIARIRALGSTGAKSEELQHAVDSLMRLWTERFDEHDVTRLRCVLANRVAPALILLGRDAMLDWAKPVLDSSDDPCPNGALVTDAWRAYLLVEADSIQAAHDSFDRALVDIEGRPFEHPFNFYLLAHLASALDRRSDAERMYARLDGAGVWTLYTSGMGRVGYDWGLITLSYLYRARAFERWGEDWDAAQYYQRFLDAWQWAEPELQFYADSARAGLERLGR